MPMHKKRGIAVAAVVFIVILVTVFVASDYYYYVNSQRLINALKIMRLEPERGFDICGEIEIDDYAKDCYSTYLSVQIELVREKYAGYEELEGQEKRDTIIKMLNEISDHTDTVCSVDLMRYESDACAQVKAVLELQKEKLINGE
ncbi:hypothetical protein GF345_00465 [Candidatus Woesearchaeota archaeon]|nr:hypothetical protein [Candidatus Woesearchaeota archaeon]